MSRWKILNAGLLVIVGIIASLELPAGFYPILAAAPPVFRVEGMDFSNIPGVTVLPRRELPRFVFPEGRKSAPKRPSVLTPDSPGAFPIPTDIHSKAELIPLDSKANIVLIRH
jgi:hypothetical protein